MSAPVGNPAPGGIGLAAPPSGAPPTAAAATPAAPKSNTPDVATGVVPSLRPPTAAGTKPSAMKTTPGAALGVLKAAASAHKPPLTSLKPPYTGSASVPRVGGLGSGGARGFLSPNSAAARLRNATGMKRGAGTGRLADVLGSGARLMKKKKSSDAQTSKEKNTLPESEVFSYLQEYEKRLTRLLNRRKANIKDALSNPPTVKKKLRIYIYNTHANQEAPGEQGEPAAGGEQQAAESRELPSWQLVVYGRELSVTETEAEAESSSGGWGAAAPASGGGCPLTGGSGSDGLPEEASREDVVAFGCHPFSFYMKLVEIQLDEQQYPGAEGSINWRKDQHEGSHHASLVVHRLGSKPVNATIRLHLDWGHDHYQLKEPLARLLVCQRASRPTVLRLLWNYINMQGLQDAQDRALIRCNPRLRAIFGAEEITAASLPERITSQLAPIEPAVINYTIRVDGPSPSHPTCFDLDVDMPYSGKPSLKLPDFLHNHSRELEIQACEQKIVEQLKVVRESMRRRTLLQGFAEAPIAFINAAVTTQAQEMRMTWSDKDYEACTKSDFFKGKWVEDAATSYLRNRLQ